MFFKDKWPFTPVRLSQIIDQDTLSVIEAGCSERLGRAMTIIDVDQQSYEISRTDSLNLQRQFESFCACLRDERHVQGGNEACEECDEMAARTSLMSKRTPYRSFRCHMGLFDATHVVHVRQQPVAILFSGQFRPPEGTETIEKNVSRLGRGAYAHIQLYDEGTRHELRSLIDKLPEVPADFPQRLEREAEHIEKIAEAEYQRIKSLWEQEFLDSLRAFTGCDEATTLGQLRRCTSDLLERIQKFCRCRYLVFFASIRESDTVLAPIATVGIPASLKEKLPHFNWKKAWLPLENASIKRRNVARGHEAVVKGIRGDNSDYFNTANCVLPTILGKRYRGALIFGPFAEPINLVEEGHFLSEVANSVGSFVLTELEVLHLEQERRHWESTAKLLIHQLRTALTPITTQVGSAKLLVQRLGKDNIFREVANTLKRTEELCLRLGKSARETLAAHVLLLEPDDLEFEQYPLSVLVANCAENFAPEADKRSRQVILDKSVELLPQAEVDVARLTIALSNIFENALKYSYPHTVISVRGAVELAGDLAQARALIQIDDLGDAIHAEDQERIFEQGTRALTGAKLGRIPGTGLGLWEVRAVVNAHAGTITVRSEPTSIHRRQGPAYHVTFSIRIPLRRPK
jgi:signal transduction histidine kinase/ligand-binding sensor protein